jgi:hypothetical protein
MRSFRPFAGSAALAGILLAGCAHGASRGVRSVGDRIIFEKVVYDFSGLSIWFDRNYLIVEATGRVRYEHRDEPAAPGRPEFGEYEATLSRPDLEALVRKLHTADFEDREMPDGFPIHAPYKCLTVVQGGRGHGPCAFNDGPQNKRLEELALEMERMAERALEHPRCAVRMRLVDLAISGRHASATVELASIGREVVRVPDPRVRHSGTLVARVHRDVWWVAPDFPDEPLLAIEEVGVSTGELPETAVLEIPAGRARTFRLAFDFRPEQSRASMLEIEFRSPQNNGRPEGQVLIGRMQVSTRVALPERSD